MATKCGEGDERDHECFNVFTASMEMSPNSPHNPTKGDVSFAATGGQLSIVVMIAADGRRTMPRLWRSRPERGLGLP